MHFYAYIQIYSLRLASSIFPDRTFLSKSSASYAVVFRVHQCSTRLVNVFVKTMHKINDENVIYGISNNEFVMFTCPLMLVWAMIM